MKTAFFPWIKDVFSVWEPPYPKAFSNVLEIYRKEYPDFPFHAAFAAHPYSEDFARDLKRFKYRAERSALDKFDVSLRKLAEICRTTVPENAFVAYPPSPFSRTLLRGYDHTALLAGRFATYAGLPSVPILKTPWMRSRQAGGNSVHRMANVSNKFFLPSWSGRYSGLPVVFFDDVLSSGATALSCVEALEENGNREFYGFFLSSPSAVSESGE